MTPQSNPAAHTTAAAVLKKLLCASLIGAIGAIAAPANAALITFDATQNVTTPALNAGDSAYNTGDAFTEAGFTLQVHNSATADANDYGLVGALVDSNNAYACLITACPAGTGSTYFAGLNDGVLNLTNAGAAGFRVDGLRYAFVAPLSGLQNASFGQLVLTGTTQAGGTISTSANFAGQDNAGRFTFDQFLVDSAFRGTTLTSLSINACLFDGDGTCSSMRDFTQNQAQFALDDLDLTVIPEPSSYALMLLGMVGLTVVSRRRQS